MVLDFRKLNENAIADSYPLPNIMNILNQLENTRYFLGFDLATEFHHIPMDPKDTHKTPFSTSFAHYEFNRMSFRLRNAPETFQRIMGIGL